MAWRTPACVEAWNGIRAIDYLCKRPEVDPGKIGVTGASGGGEATFWIAGTDERIKVAVPVSGSLTFRTLRRTNGVRSGPVGAASYPGEFGTSVTPNAAP